MAINVNNVYQTVLSILNKEQRGFLTPDEFNKVATQVQLDIFENYFEDGNQQLRVTQDNTEYFNRQKNINSLISIFKTVGNTTYIPSGSVQNLTVNSGGTGYSNANNVATTGGSGSGLTVDISVDAGVITSANVSSSGSDYIADETVSVSGGTSGTLRISSVNSSGYFLPPASLHRIGTVMYENTDQVQIEVEQVQQDKLLTLNRSELTKPNENFPVYMYENPITGTNGNDTGQPHIRVYPTSIASSGDITVSYIRKPSNVVWGFNIPDANLGTYVYNRNTSTQFELDATEQTEVVLRILAYAGVIIRDPQIVQAASQGVQAEEVNSKS